MEAIITYEGRKYKVEAPEGTSESDISNAFVDHILRVEEEKVPSPSFTDALAERAVGMGETLYGMAHNTAVESAAGLAGIGDLFTGKSLDEQADTIRSMQEKYSYQPSTPGGQSYSEELGGMVGEVEQKVDDVSKRLGMDPEVVKPLLLMGITASPFAGTIGRTTKAGIERAGQALSARPLRETLKESGRKPLVERKGYVEPTEGTTPSYEWWSRDPFGKKLATPVETTRGTLPSAVITQPTREKWLVDRSGFISSADVIAQSISPAIAGRLRWMEAQALRKASEFDDVFVNDMRTNLNSLKKTSPERYIEFKKAWINQDRKTASKIYEESVGPALAREHFSKLNKAFAQRGKELNSVYPTFKMLPSYLPRIVKHPDKLLSKLSTDNQNRYVKLRDEFEAGKIDEVTYSDKLNDILSTGVKEIAPGAKTIHAKQRKKDAVTDIELDAYVDPEDVLPEYFRSTGISYAEKSFLGKGESTIDSIGNFLAQHPQLSANQVGHLRKMLLKRFGPKTHVEMSRGVQAMKDVGYMGTIADMASAITQFGDVAGALARQGVFNTLRGISQSAMPKALRKRQKTVEPEDIGVKDIMHETAQHHGRVGKSLDTLLKYAGFKAVDKFGKRVVLNSALNRLKRQAIRNPKHLEKAYSWMGKERVNEFIKDVAIGDIKNKNVHFAIFNELMDVQPMTLSQMPLKYLTNPNGRIFYALKTWGIRQINRYREDALKGDYGRLVGHALAIYGATNSIDLGKLIFEKAIKGDSIKEEEITKEAANNLLATAFASTYMMEKVGRGQGAEALADPFIPVVFDMIFYDVYKAMQGDWKPIVSRIPVVGRTIKTLMDEE